MIQWVIDNAPKQDKKVVMNIRKFMKKIENISDKNIRINDYDISGEIIPETES